VCLTKPQETILLPSSFDPSNREVTNLITAACRIAAAESLGEK